MSRDDLDDILEDDGGETVAETVAPSAPAETAAPPAETGDKPSEAAPPAAATPPIESESDLVPRKGLLDERRKRQELQRKLEEYEARLKHQPPPQPQPPPDWLADPEQAARTFEEQMQVRLYQTAVYQSETIMRDKHQDYDDVAAYFAEVAKEDPSLAAQVFQHPFPAQFAYQHGKRLMLLKEIGDDPDAYKAKLEAELRAKLTSEPAPTATAKTVSAPRSLARDVSQQPRANGKFASYDQPAPLDDILGN